jgi:hypothetical protein
MEICPTCHRPITSGKLKSTPECRMLHAIFDQLAMFQEKPVELIKRYIKLRACANGYRYDEIKEVNRTVIEPLSIAYATHEEVALLIETCYLVAQEWNCELRGE